MVIDPIKIASLGHGGQLFTTTSPQVLSKDHHSCCFLFKKFMPGASDVKCIGRDMCTSSVCAKTVTSPCCQSNHFQKP